jgi:hypothetical protein
MVWVRISLHTRVKVLFFSMTRMNNRSTSGSKSVSWDNKSASMLIADQEQFRQSRPRSSANLGTDMVGLVKHKDM